MPIAPDLNREPARIGHSVRIHGEITGQEDLLLDGEMDGNIQLPGQRVTIGPTGRLHGQVHARELIIHGKLQGDVVAQERLEIRKTGAVEGKLTVNRLSIEDGAFFKGSVTPIPGTAERNEPIATAPATAGPETLRQPWLTQPI